MPSLRAVMIQGGCRPTGSGKSGLAIALTDRDGQTIRFNCDAIGKDSMFSLADAYDRILKGIDESAPAIVSGGFWTIETRYREYCWVNRVTWEIHYCGIFFSYFVDVWVPGENQPEPSGDEAPGGGWSDGQDNGESHPPDELPRCEQSLADTTCHRPLTPDDLVAINNAIQLFRDTSGVWADTAARRQCAELVYWLDFMRGRPRPWGVFRGRDSISTPVHNAQGYQGNGRFHLDPPILRDANTPHGLRALASALLHETIHATGLADHPTGTNESPPNYALYDYFKYTDVSGPNSCVS